MPNAATRQSLYIQPTPRTPALVRLLTLTLAMSATARVTLLRLLLCPQGVFTEDEDRRLLDLVDQHGRKWKLIGQELGRLPEQCRDRWRHIGINQQRTTGERPIMFSKIAE